MCVGEHRMQFIGSRQRCVCVEGVGCVCVCVWGGVKPHAPLYYILPQGPGSWAEQMLLKAGLAV